MIPKIYGATRAHAQFYLVRQPEPGATFSVGGVTFSATVADPTQQQFRIGADLGETARNIAAAIVEFDTGALGVQAYGQADFLELDKFVVRLVAAKPGPAGNAITMDCGTVFRAMNAGGMTDGVLGDDIPIGFPRVDLVSSFDAVETFNLPDGVNRQEILISAPAIYQPGGELRVRGRFGNGIKELVFVTSGSFVQIRYQNGVWWPGMNCGVRFE